MTTGSNPNGRPVARAETVASKPSFRSAFEARRIIVPADGFYEWHALGGGRKQPHYFARADGAPLALAGLAEWWRDRNGPPTRHLSAPAASSPPRPDRTWRGSTTACR
ncbi:MAG: SOS response-associated peptidase family protein [Acidimicrobiales bacterium]